MYPRVLVKNGRCLDSRRVYWLLFTLEVDLGGGSGIPGFFSSRARRHPESPLLSTFATLRQDSVPSH